MRRPEPITLATDRVRLEPLQAQHAPGLGAAAADGELWTLRVTSVPAPGEAATHINTALRGQAEGHMLPFAVVDAASNTVIGHALRRDGTVRDTVMYSVTADEWPEVRERLAHQLDRAPA